MLPQCLAGARVLVVDDDPFVRKLVQETVSSAGGASYAAEDTIGALRAVDQERPDLIICDLNLPGAGGVAVVEGACAIDSTYARRSILVSGEVLPIDVQFRMEQLGIAMLEKPFRLIGLLDTLKGLLRPVKN